MTLIHGFELIKEDDIPELNTRARLYRHRATGAELLSMENNDENKVFGITFRTPPPDSTGLPHIMEHSVLCGSRKYPVREPFVELMKGSLNTFLNAMTFPDKTTYPVASQNLQDFYNLVDVYLDAVFHPRLTPEILQQEGWHYELNAPDAPLEYKGVVFNEMKGAYSSPDNLMGRYSQQSLFPDTAYGLDSGGDPEVIPNLTYEQFRAFHQTYYHPSNARIYFYGDDDPETRLSLIQEYLSEFEEQPVNSGIDLQPALSEPQRFVYAYPASEEEDKPKAMAMVNWLLPENKEPEIALSLAILSHILVGIPASPLRKALIDSGLGEEVIGDGLDDNLRQLAFSIGLKGVLPANADKVEALILDTLQDLAEKGIDPEMVEAAVNTVEFRLREQNYGRYPRGLVLMIQALTTWLHDDDPVKAIAFEEPLGRVKARLAEQPELFSRLVREHLLENTHRVSVILTPDPELRRKQIEAERARLDTIRAQMTDDALAALVTQTQYLKRLQETPDSPEALATIPSLGLEDLDKSPKPVPTEISELHGAQVLFHDLFTNGIVYLDLGFDLHALPQTLIPYAELFGTALLEMGTETEDFVKLTQRIARETGGITPTTLALTVRDTSNSAARLFLRGKATVARADALLAILRDILLTAQLDNRERFKQIVLERKAQQEAMLVPMGHRVALSRLRAQFNEAYWAGEQINGLEHLFFLRELADRIEQDWPSVLTHLEQIRRLLVNPQSMLCNVTVDGESWVRIAPRLEEFLGEFPVASVSRAAWSPAYRVTFEGLTLPANVNYVAKGADLYDLGCPRHGSLEVIAHYLRSTWLWERVRVQGGAYGGFCVFDQHSGLFSYVSYRDPNLVATLDVYDKTPDFLRALDLSQEELVKSIIGTIGAMDAYELPDAKGYSAMSRYLAGYSEEARQQYRTEVLQTTAAHFVDFADVLERVRDVGRVVVLGAKDVIEAANAERQLGLELVRAL